MGSAEEREWVDVANDLLRKCNLNLHLSRLSECGAEVFIHLYQAILGEKVPDLITVPSCQEDDAHNVQAVIDSLALDYLQVSLSHITGENVVKGDKESVRNLLEIFDGLLEYLTEEISEAASQNGDDHNQMATGEVQSGDNEEQEDYQEIPVPSRKLPSAMGSSALSELLAPSEEADGSESTSELIKLGDTAYLFSLRNAELPVETVRSKRITESEEPEAFSEPSRMPFWNRRIHITKTEGIAESTELSREQTNSSAKKLGEPIRPAIPLQPPYQPSVSRSLFPAERDSVSGSPPPSSKPQSLVSPDLAEPLEQKSAALTEYLAGNNAQTSDGGTDKTVLEDTAAGGKEMLSQDENGQCTPTSRLLDAWPKSTSLKSARPRQRNVLFDESQNEFCTLTDSLEEEPFPHRRAKEKLSQQELHEMSEKLSCRLKELDVMLKLALGERTREESSTEEEDQLSQHSDSVMDYRETEAESATSRLRRLPSRRRSVSASPPPSSHQLSSEFGGERWKDMRGPVGKIRERLLKEDDQMKQRAKLLAKTYKDELRAYEASKQFECTKLKAKAKEMEQKHKEDVFKAPQRISQAAMIYSRKTGPRNPKYSQWISRGGYAKAKKAAPLRIKEDTLLPQLLENFPHMHISRPTMNKMLQQQLTQIEQLKSPVSRNQLKFQSEVLETLKKHDLLVDLIKKEQAHNRRLQEFKQRIHRQKYTQNKLRERRQEMARTKKYYQDYRVQLRAKMMRARTREEKIFKNLFEEGLVIQKQRLQELRAYAKEKRAEQRVRHQDELESMENYYKDQFAMLAEAVSVERQEIQARECAHAKTLKKTKSELRAKVEKEIKELQDMIMCNDDNSFFRELEAERLRSRLLVASFQYSKNHQFL